MKRELSQWPWNVKAREKAKLKPRKPSPPKLDPRYEPIDYALIPVGVKWKPYPPYTGSTRAYVSLFGAQYKLIRTLETGAVAYFVLKDKGPAPTPKAQLDAEPEGAQQQRYYAGSSCWYVDSGRWFLMTVLAREGARMVITSVTGWDAEREKEWPVGVRLTLDRYGELGKRLRPLKDRKP